MTTPRRFAGLVHAVPEVLQRGRLSPTLSLRTSRVRIA